MACRRCTGGLQGGGSGIVCGWIGVMCEYESMSRITVTAPLVYTSPPVVAEANQLLQSRHLQLCPGSFAIGIPCFP